VCFVAVDAFSGQHTSALGRAVVETLIDGQTGCVGNQTGLYKDAAKIYKHCPGRDSIQRQCGCLEVSSTDAQLAIDICPKKVAIEIATV
jgi:hypothetical protein